MSAEKPKPIKIDKHWESTAHQYASDSAGNKWIVASLIEESKDLPTMNVPLRHMCFGREVATIGGMSIRDFVGHMRMVLDADLSKPIILDQDGNPFDGKHRIAKALLEGKSTIKAKRFDVDPRPSIQGSDE